MRVDRVEEMWSFVSRVGSSEPKMPLLKGPPIHILGNVGFATFISDKQFPSFINRANPATHNYQNCKMERTQEKNSSPNNKPESVTKNQNCNSKKKKKKRRRRRKKKNNQETKTEHSNNCQRQRQLSTTESEDSFIVFFDEALDVDQHISELSENETVTEDFDSSDSVVPTKKVRFADELCEVHPMIMWSYAYQAARKGPWEEYARDRDRFCNRIKNVEASISHIFDPKHRAKVYNERFVSQN